MGENKQAIEIKKEHLKKELSKQKPNYLVIKRLKESINRHKKLDKRIKLNRWKNKKR